MKRSIKRCFNLDSIVDIGLVTSPNKVINSFISVIIFSLTDALDMILNSVNKSRNKVKLFKAITNFLNTLSSLLFHESFYLPLSYLYFYCKY